MTAVLPLDFTTSHTRYKNAAGKVVPGVTTVLSLLAKPALIAWAHKLGREGKELERTRQQAADIGTVAHGYCEAHLRGMTLDVSSVAPALLGPANLSFTKFREHWDRMGLTVLHTEHQMVSERWQVGGTADILAKREADGALFLWDLKTSRGVYDEHLLQVAAYAEMYEETTGQHVDQCWIVRIPKEEGDGLELREVDRRPALVEAFGKLVEARRALQAAKVRV